MWPLYAICVVAHDVACHARTPRAPVCCLCRVAYPWAAADMEVVSLTTRFPLQGMPTLPQKGYEVDPYSHGGYPPHNSYI
jgi:hypothetical protein